MGRIPRGWAVALGALLLFALARWGLGGTTGLVRTVVTNTADHSFVDNRPVETIDLIEVDAAAGGQDGVTARWRGAWELPATGFYTLELGSRGPASWTIDDAPAVETTAATAQASRALWLTAGFHTTEIQYAVALSA